MGALIETYYKLETLEMLVKGIKAKGEKGINITTSVNDETKPFTGKKADGSEFTIYQNVSSFVSQTKEQRDARKERYYVANGGVKWTDGSIKVASANNTPTNTTNDQQAGYGNSDDDLPF